MDELREQINEIVSVHKWKFDGLPEEVIIGLEHLQQSYDREEIVDGMKALIKELEVEANQTKLTAGNSGLAAEMHMAVSMRIKYLLDGIKLIKKVDIGL